MRRPGTNKSGGFDNWTYVCQNRALQNNYTMFSKEIAKKCFEF